MSYSDSHRAEIIRYAQSWEDPEVMSTALDVGPSDDVCSIASGGENTFALLLNGPNSIYAVDWSRAQLALVELKMRAIDRLSYDQFVGFVGARPTSERLDLYRAMRLDLSESARSFWDGRPDDIVRGIIHAGTLEEYFGLFRRFVLRCIHSADTVRELFERRDQAEQHRFYHERWNNRRWRFLFRLFYSRLMLGRVARGTAAFSQVQMRNIAEELFKRTYEGFTEVPTHSNYFLEYMLKGSWSDLESAHPYLRSKHYEVLRSRLGSVRLMRGSLEYILSILPAGSFSRFNCSDIFEYMTQEAYERTVSLILHASRPASRMAFWTMFVPRDIPEAYQSQIHPMPISFDVSRTNRTFFYGGFHVWELLPNAPGVREGGVE